MALSMTEDDVMRVAQFNPYIPAGTAFVTHLPGRGAELWARHPADLTPARLGTRWHLGPFRCPTWIDDECRCMTEGT